MSRLNRTSEEQVPAMVFPSFRLMQPFVPRVPTRMSPRTLRRSGGFVVPMPTLPFSLTSNLPPVVPLESIWKSPKPPKEATAPPPVLVCTRKPAAPGSTTCSRKTGAVTPMPTLAGSALMMLPSASTLVTELTLPSTTELLFVTSAKAPMAEAFTRLLEPTSTNAPSNVLKAPVALVLPDFTPNNVLPSPDVLLSPALLPKKELNLPPELDSTFTVPVPMPTNVLPPGVLESPVTANTRLLPMLNCAAESVPPTVPLPEMLKFAF